MTIFFEVRAAACRVDDNHVAVVWLEHVDVVPGKSSTLVGLTCMDVKCSAAMLLRRRDYLAAVGSQYAYTCFVYVAKDLVHYAAADKANAVAPSSCRGCDLR